MADLAILIGGEPRFLFEIKEDDLYNASKFDQIGDYIRYIGSQTVLEASGTAFVHVSRYAPPERIREALRSATESGVPVAELRYRMMHNVLEKVVSTRDPAGARVARPIARMLQDYLVD